MAKAPANEFLDEKPRMIFEQDYHSSPELLAKLQDDKTVPIMLSFSSGKDSIGCYLNMRRAGYENIVLVFLYRVPDLEFQEISLRYYEQLWNTKIVRLPHPAFYKQLWGFMYQPPSHLDIIEDHGFEPFSYDQVFAAAKLDRGLDMETWVGTGVRMADSIMRRTSIKKHGAVNYNRRQFFPIYDFSLADVIGVIKSDGVKLPIDYRIWGRSFDGFDYRFIEPLKKWFPADYEKIRAYFPLIEIELKRFKDFT
jgi:3'-phosphoadenosine 5'-phosphosulfate sulfotransferase (PAPS reductase)/FAD synthetase